MKRIFGAILAPSSLPDDVWHERQRWLLWFLWAHVAGLAAYALAEGHLAGSGGPFLLPAAAFALLASLHLPPRMVSPRIQSVLVSLGLLSASVALGELWNGEAEAAFHASLVIVLLMLYEDPALLIVAVLFIADQFALRDVPLGMAAGPMLFAGGVALAGFVTVHLSSRLRADALEATQRFRSSFDNAPIGQAVVSPEGRFLDVNNALCEILGYKRETLLARTIQSLTLPEDLKQEGDLIGQMVRSQRRTTQRHKRFLHAEGHAVWISLSLSLVYRGEGVPEHLIVQVEDITDRKRSEDRLQHLADHDGLTGLLNRRRLEQEIAQQIRLAERYRQRRACLVMLDLDDFKSINDSLGHGAGDELLKGIGDVLRERVRRSDMVARVGGDEFAILLPQASREQAMRVAEAVGQAIRDRLCISAGHELHTTASIGVAAVDPDDTPDSVLLRADQAMYEAKAAGRDAVVLAGPPLPLQS
jgi:diguanylate cyclase (GGDEF)-like protein/PAS domain S-box-containing protein